MKKVLGLLIAFVLVVILFVANMINNYSTKYEIDATIISTEEETIAKDKNGNLWAFENDEFKIGDRVKLTMNDNHTPQIEDDEILEIK